VDFKEYIMRKCLKCSSTQFTAEGSENGDILTCMNCGSNNFTSDRTNKATFKNFEVKASYKGTKKADWSSDNFNNHMVTVTNTETEQKITFEFWASIANPELNKEYDILNAFYCFVGDAISGMETFESFCSEFGYDSDSRTAEKIYKKCKKQLEKLNKIYDGSIYDLVNELSEQYA
jgi:hypothetical protein